MPSTKTDKPYEIESLQRLVSAVLVEIDDKWAAADKGYIKWEKQDD